MNDEVTRIESFPHLTMTPEDIKDAGEQREGARSPVMREGYYNRMRDLHNLSNEELVEAVADRHWLSENAMVKELMERVCPGWWKEHESHEMEKLYRVALAIREGMNEADED